MIKIISIVRSKISDLFSDNIIELSLLIHFGINTGLKNQFALLAITKLNAKKSTFLKSIITLFLISQKLEIQASFFLFIFQIFCSSKKLKDRKTVEKAFWSFIITDGLFFTTDFPIFTDFLYFFIIYCFAHSLFKENSFPQFLATNVIFLSNIFYFLICYWPYIHFLIIFKLSMIFRTLLKIGFGIFTIILVQKMIQTKTIIVRKYFHFLAFFLFVFLILEEVF